MVQQPTKEPKMADLQIQLARDAVIEAIEAIVARGERPHSHNVPIEAQRIMISKGRATITDAIASDQIMRAIVSLNDNEKIEAHMEPRKTWRIVDTHVSSSIPSTKTDTENTEVGVALAESAVVNAIEILVSQGQRPHSHNVPMEAERIMISEGRGRITEAMVSGLIKEAIVTLHDRRKIEAHMEPRKTWRIVGRID